MTDLKKCPCCGSQAELRMGYNHGYVRCVNQNCLLTTRRFQRIEDAQECWNRRFSEVFE